MTAGIAATGLLLTDVVPPAAAMLSWGLAGLGIGVAYSTVALVVLEAAPRGEEGAAAAALQLAFVVGTALGTAATGAIVARWEEDGRSLAVAIALVFAVACALAILALAAGARLPDTAER